MSETCTHIESELSAYIDGEIASAGRAEVEAHLRACASCRGEFARVRGVSRVLRRWDAQETRYATSTGFRNRVLTRVGAPSVRPSVRWVNRIAAAVAFVAAGTLAWAVVAPRVSFDGSTELARVREEVRRLSRQIETMSAARPAADAPVAESKSDEPGFPRLEPLGPVVPPPSPDEVATVSHPAEDAWDQRGDGRILRDAWRDHDAFERSRLALGLEEKLRQLEERPAAPPSTTAGTPAPSPLADFLAQVHVTSGNFSSYDNVQVFPIESNAARVAEKSGFLTCQEAMALREVAIVEGPSEDTVVADNMGPSRKPVLVLAGDVLCGGRQDRVAREDTIVPPGRSISIPTYASGKSRGRTSYKWFQHSDGMATPEIRALIAADRALVAGVDQAIIDRAVERTVKALATPRPRGSLDDLFSNSELQDRVEKSVSTLEKRLQRPNVVGFAVAAGGTILGAEVFGSHATFDAHRGRLLRSYVMAAFAKSRLEGVTPESDTVTDLLKGARSAVFEESQSGGSGSLACFRSMNNGAFGCGLLDGSKVVHAMLYAGLPIGVETANARGGRRSSSDGNPAPADSNPAGRGEEGSGAGGAGVK